MSIVPMELPPQQSPISSRAPRLWLTSMSGPGAVANMTEMIEPLLPWLDGIIWVLNDVPRDDPGARYLATVCGTGCVVHRDWPRQGGPLRHWAAMNDTLFTGLIEEGAYVLFCDPLERPSPAFVSRIKPEIGPMMEEADVALIAYYGKPYLFRYRETLEYRNTPHWSLHGWGDRGIEWSTIEPDESKVRLNVRPIKRTDPHHWVGHYLRYMVSCPAGSNHAALGIEQYAQPGEAHQTAFQRREANRLAFRREMRQRGFELTVDGFVAMCNASQPVDDSLKAWLRSDKVFSDAYHWLVLGNPAVRDTHRPSDALPIS